jgi:flagellar basal body-associated protein FliL
LEGKASFIILVAIVAFLSLALALLGGYVFFIQGHNSNDEPESVTKVESTKPKDDELSRLALFDEKKVFSLKNEANSKTMPMLQVDGVEILYFKTVAGIKNPMEKLNLYKSELREMVSLYFQSIKIEEVKSAESRENIKKDLVKRMNDKLKENEKSKNDIIYNITIQDWIYS